MILIYSILFSIYLIILAITLISLNLFNYPNSYYIVLDLLGINPFIDNYYSFIIILSYFT